MGATANRVRALAAAVADRPGVRVTVVGPGPDIDPASVDWDEFDCAIVSKSERAYSKRNLLQRALREMRQTWRLLSEARRRDPDALMVTSPSVFLLSASLLERAKPIVIDLRDLVWEYFLARGGTGKVVGAALQRFSLFCLRRAAAVTVTNEHERDSLARLDIRHPVLIRNGIDRYRFDALEAIAAAGLRDGGSCLHIVYVGNVGLAQGLGTLVRAAAGLFSVKATIIGGGADLARVQQMVKELEADNVALTGPLKWDRVCEYYGQADVLYAQVGAAYETAVPSKLFEYLATGRRVIFGGPEGSAVELMRGFEGVWIVPPDDPVSLISAIKSVEQEPLGSPLMANVTKVKSDYLREYQADRFADLMLDFAKDQTP